MRRGWYWGSQAFAERLLALGQTTLKRKRNRRYRAAPENRAHGQLEAQRLLHEGLQAAGLQPGQLSQIKGSDPRKVAIARTIRRRTTMSMGWIAEKLSMRTAANVSQQLRRRPDIQKKLPKTLQTWIIQLRIVA